MAALHGWRGTFFMRLLREIFGVLFFILRHIEK
jgi:hypothetical protein